MTAKDECIKEYDDEGRDTGTKMTVDGTAGRRLGTQGRRQWEMLVGRLDRKEACEKNSTQAGWSG